METQLSRSRLVVGSITTTLSIGLIIYLLITASFSSGDGYQMGAYFLILAAFLLGGVGIVRLFVEPITILRFNSKGLQHCRSRYDQFLFLFTHYAGAQIAAIICLTALSWVWGILTNGMQSAGSIFGAFGGSAMILSVVATLWCILSAFVSTLLIGRPLRKTA